MQGVQPKSLLHALLGVRSGGFHSDGHLLVEAKVDLDFGHYFHWIIVQKSGLVTPAADGFHRGFDQKRMTRLCYQFFNRSVLPDGRLELNTPLDVRHDGELGIYGIGTKNQLCLLNRANHVHWLGRSRWLHSFRRRGD